MFKWLVTLLDRLFAVAGALVFSQAPLFIHQYSLQLAGHQAELNLQINTMRQAALQTGKSLDQYIQKFISSTDHDFQLQGEIMQAMVVRWNHLSETLSSLQDSSLFHRPFIFLQHFDTEIVKSTANNFHLGIPLNPEGACYAVIGVIFGFLTFFIIRKIVGFPFQFMKKKESNQVTS